MRDSYSVRLIVLLCLVGISAPARGWGVCGGPPRTLRQDAADCRLLVYGVPKLSAPDAKSTDEAVITDVLKSHPLVGGTKILRLPREVSIEDPKDPQPRLFFCHVHKGEIDACQDVLATPVLVRYLKGMLALDPRDQVRRLHYCFDHLGHADKAIAWDAYCELRICPPRELCRTARSFSPVKLRKLLQAPTTPEQWLSLYALLLGCCGRDSDAPLLRKLIDRRTSEKAAFNCDGVLAGYTLLRPREGLALARSLLAQPLRPFAVRYDVLSMARFFCTARLDALSREQAIDLIRATLDQEDINDISIEDLRRCRCWKASEDVFAVTRQTRFTRRAILRYALQCPGPRAAAFVAKERTKDSELVADTEELLKLEAEQRSPSK